MKTISSAMTFRMKVLFPCVWILLFGAGTMYLGAGALHGNQGEDLPEFMKWEFLVMWVIGALFLLKTCVGLKRVCLDSTQLRVSNYRREISIPLTLIADVTQNRWLNLHPITIHFRGPTEFGQAVTFIPTVRFFNRGVHPIVEELKSLAGLPDHQNRE